MKFTLLWREWTFVSTDAYFPRISKTVQQFERNACDILQTRWRLKEPRTQGAVRFDDFERKLAAKLDERIAAGQIRQQHDEARTVTEIVNLKAAELFANFMRKK